jgi:hypothetical protein
VPLLEQRVGSAGGALGAKALLRGAQRFGQAGDPDAARAWLAEARAVPGAPPDVIARIEAEERKLGPAPAAPAAGAAEAIELAPAAERAVRIITCRVLSLVGSELEVEAASGKQRKIDLRSVVAIGAGILPVRAADGRSGADIFTDLILVRGDATRPPAAVRLQGSHLGLAALYPGVTVKEAYAQFVAKLFKLSGASALPSASAFERRDYPRYASIEELNKALYG